ncbi:unnamed protein product [Haemonchus placei]|uniref:Col_cuticle_N domain-containing protein n=1 Tax=Haemonchus placei TaxID=6290 RepID=A0A158QPU7_HAEPC|nr:unnamed protein product [Haemonchus placei]
MMPMETAWKGLQVISSVTIAMSIGAVVVISNVIFVPIVWNEISLTWNQLEQQLNDVEAIRISIKKALDTLPVELTRQARDLARQRLDDETMESSTKPDSTLTRRRRTHRKREKVGRHTSRKLTLRESKLIDLSGSGGQCVCSLENKCPTGPPGPPGQNGEDGSPGKRGTPGMKGLHSMDVTAQHIFAGCLVCPAGPEGAPGERGQIGIPGPKGAPGLHGLPGRNGAPGSPGDIGPPGKPGKTGNAGEAGPRGMDGMVSEGLPGVKGKPGSRGPRGKRGDHGKNISVKGDAGPQGRAGDEGVPGLRGPEGPPGAMGLPGTPGVSPDCDCKQIRGHQSAQRHLRVHLLENQDRDAHLASVLSSLKTIKSADRSSERSSEEEELLPGEGSGEESEIATTTQPNDVVEEGPIQDFKEMKEENEAADNVHESSTTASISLPEEQNGADVGLAAEMPVIELTSEKITSPTETDTDPLPSLGTELPSQGIYDILVKVPTRTSKANGDVHRARKTGRKPIRKPPGHSRFPQPHLNVKHLSGNRNRKGVKKFKVDGDAGAVESEAGKSGQFSKPAFDIGMVFAARERKRKRLLAQRGKLVHREQSKRLRNTATNTTFNQRSPKNQINPNVDLIILPRPALTAFPVRNPTISIFNTLTNDIRTESSSGTLQQPQRAFGPPTSQQRISIPLVTPSEGEIPVRDDVERRLYAVENELRSVADVRKRSSDEQASSGHLEEGNWRSSSQSLGGSEVPLPSEVIAPLKIDIDKELGLGMTGKIRESEYALPVGLPSKIAMIYSTEPEEHKGGSDTIQEQSLDKNLVEGYVLPIDKIMDKRNSIVDLGFFTPWNAGKRRIHILLDRDSQNPSNGYVGITSRSHTESERIPAKEHITFVDRAPYSPLARARAIIGDIPSPEAEEAVEAKSSDIKRFHVSELVSDKNRRGYLHTGTKLVRVSTGNVAKKQSIGGKKKTSLAASKRKSFTPSSKKHAEIMPEFVGGRKGYEAIGRVQNSPNVWKIETMRLL